MKSLSAEWLSTHEAWDDLAASSPHSTIFHTRRWLSASTKHFRHLAVFGNDLVAGCSVEVDEQGRGASTSISPYSGPFLRCVSGQVDASHSASRNNRILGLVADRLAEIQGASFFSSPWIEDLQPFVVRAWAVSLLYTHVITLRTPRLAWESFASRLRHSISSAERAGVQIVELPGNDRDGVAALLLLSEKSFAYHGRSPRHSSEEVRTCLAALASVDRVRCFLALLRHRIIAAICIVYDERRAHYLLGGTDRLHGHSGATALALWSAIQYAANNGITEFDFEGSHIASIDCFFRGFGGRLVPFYFCHNGTRIAP
jgi:hypothetical protein